MAIPAALRYIWASPVSVLGVGMAIAALMLGAKSRLHTGVLEVSLQARSASLARAFARLPFGAITLGHVVLACSEAEQERLRVHERVHVTQYELWGVVFPAAYAAESFLQLLLGHRPYQDNRFEVSARVAEERPALVVAASGA